VEAQREQGRDPSLEDGPEAVPGILHRAILVRVPRPHVRGDPLDLDAEPMPFPADVLVELDPILRAEQAADRVVYDRGGQARRMLLEDREPSFEIREELGRGVSRDVRPAVASTSSAGRRWGQAARRRA
jgi:hypothetical protein